MTWYLRHDRCRVNSVSLDSDRRKTTLIQTINCKSLLLLLKWHYCTENSNSHAADSCPFEHPREYENIIEIILASKQGAQMELLSIYIKNGSEKLSLNCPFKVAWASFLLKFFNPFRPKCKFLCSQKRLDKIVVCGLIY
jgi:hypothetical protein